MQYKDINDYEVLYLIGENQLEEKDIIFKKYKLQFDRSFFNSILFINENYELINFNYYCRYGR